MAPTDIIYAAFERVIQRAARRTIAWLFVVVAVLAALYQATVAVTVELELQLGAMYAHLAIAAFYLVFAAVVIIVLFSTARRASLSHVYRGSVTQLPPELQVATIVEALLLGYAMSRRR